MPKTSCKDCIFAQYEDITQYGCLFDRISVYKKNGLDVTECYDNEKEFFCLDTFCVFSRTNEWLNNHTLDEGIQGVVKDTTLKYTTLIWTNGSIDEISKTIDSLLINSIPPKRVIILNRRDKPIQTESLSLMLELKEIPWKIQNPTEDIGLERSIDLAVHNLDTPVYFVIDAGIECGIKDISKINDRLNLGNFFFSIIEYGNNKKLINYKVHKLLNGNHFDSTLKEKLIKLEQKNEWPQTIFQFNTLEDIEH